MSQNALPPGATFTNLTLKMSTTAAIGFVTGNFAGPLTTVCTAATATFSTPIVAGGWLPVTLTSPFPWV